MLAAICGTRPICWQPHDLQCSGADQRCQLCRPAQQHQRRQWQQQGGGGCCGVCLQRQLGESRHRGLSRAMHNSSITAVALQVATELEAAAELKCIEGNFHDFRITQRHGRHWQCSCAHRELCKLLLFLKSQSSARGVAAIGMNSTVSSCSCCRFAGSFSTLHLDFLCFDHLSHLHPSEGITCAIEYCFSCSNLP